MDTSGFRLISTLGLDKIYNAPGDIFISRVILPHSQKVNIIYFDSVRKKMPKAKIKFLPYVGMVFSGKDFSDGDYTRPTITPAIPLDIWNGNTQNYIFLVVDLAYQMHLDKKNFTRMPESTQKVFSERGMKVFLGKEVLQEISLADLRDKDNVSDLTAQTAAERQKYMQGANINTKLIDADINTNDGSVTFKFLTEATEGIYPKDHVYQDANRRTGKLTPNPSKTYELWIKVLNVFGKDSWLSTYPDTTTLTAKDIKDILDVSDVQLWSNDPSWWWQGFNYWNSQLDSAIFPNNIKPQRWDKIHGDGQSFLTKHFFQLFKQIKFFLNPMASMLNKKLKERGIL